MRFVAVDWSGAKKPRNKIWLAEACAGEIERLERVDSRDAAIGRIGAYLHRDEPTIVGLDFSFSFPAWFCQHLGAASAVDVWRIVADQGERWLASCAWPFWGRPGKPRPQLSTHLRRTEARVGAALGVSLSSTPKSTFQVGGAGAVGTGSIRGMPHLLKLRQAGCAVWPFDPVGRVTIVEIYPRALTGKVTKSREEARRAYVRASTWPLSAAHRRAACQSEDAFDALVSALVMSEHGARLQALPTLDDVARVEGDIWIP